ncbi:MAG TPA: hypothetical protein VE398_02400 [Acidobacteriota bacterium]|nr:hypothetical protein [Acidobacteriota bacterium]
MQASDILEKIAKTGSDREKIAAELAVDPGAIPAIIGGLNADKPEVRFGCSKVLRLISMKKPAILYPHMDFFIAMLEHNNTFLRLDAARVIANLATVDSEGRFERIFDKFFAPISGPTMIPAANVIGVAPGIARARPQLADKIAVEILKVAGARYATRECRNVALGHAIKSLDQFYDLLEHKAPVAQLIKRQLKNTRPATRKKAELFVRRHGI